MPLDGDDKDDCTICSPCAEHIQHRYCARFTLIVEFHFLCTIWVAYITPVLEKNSMPRVESKLLIVAQKASGTARIQTQLRKPHTLSSPPARSPELTHHLATVTFPRPFPNSFPMTKGSG